MEAGCKESAWVAACFRTELANNGREFGPTFSVWGAQALRFVNLLRTELSTLIAGGPTRPMGVNWARFHRARSCVGYRSGQLLRRAPPLHSGFAVRGSSGHACFG